MSLFQRLPVLALSFVLAACGTSSGSSGELGGSGGSGGSGASGAGESGGGGSGGEGGQPVCPSLENAAVHYLSQDPAQCDLTDCGGAETDCIPCSGNQEYFSDEVCGCGCIDLVPATCPDPSDPSVHYLETDPALCGLTDCGGAETDCIPCEPAQEYFENECGCGCIDPST